MTNEEVAAFVAQLQAGKRFVTRFQEEEWGLTYLGNGRYHKWSRRYDDDLAGDGRPQESEETLTEIELMTLLTTHYRYDTMVARLRD